MRATYYIGGKRFDIRSKKPSQPGSMEVTVRVAYCGICGTDRHIFHGKMDSRVKFPEVIGHEMSGIIESIGPDVTGLNVGDHVVVRPLDSCEICPACKNDFSHICNNLKFIGIDSPGAFQEQWVVKASLIHKIPTNIPLKTAALIEPLAVACHDLRRAGGKKGEYAVILGGGPIGLLIALVCREAGLQVLVSEVNPLRLKLAEALRLETIDPSQSDIKERVFEATSGAGADIVFEAAAIQDTATLMTELPRCRGRIVSVGIFSEAPRIDLHKFFWRELELRGARVYERGDYDRAIELLAADSLPLEKLISATFALNDIQQAFESLDDNPNAMKVLIEVGK